MDTIHENENIEALQEDELIPVVTLGAAAIRVARALNEKSDRLEVHDISDIRADGDAESVQEFAFTERQPIRFLLYDRSEIGLDVVKASAASAKAGGRLIAFEIAAHNEKPQLSWRLGTDVLIRVESEEQCRAAAEALLYIVFSPMTMTLDAGDVLVLFDGMDVVHVGIGEATCAQAVCAAADQALAQLGWKPEFLRGILLSVAGGESLGMKDLDAATNFLMDRVSEDCNLVFGADIDPALGDTVRVTLLATCGKRKDSHDASAWMMRMLEEKFEDGENG